MESNRRPIVPQLTRRELVRVCNEKLTCAARDLAEFTRNGINASYIVAMAHKCETLAQSLDEKSQAQVNPETRQVETDLKEAIANICGLGRTIFQHDPLRRKDYELAAKPVTRQQAQRFPHL